MKFAFTEMGASEDDIRTGKYGFEYGGAFYSQLGTILRRPRASPKSIPRSLRPPSEIVTRAGSPFSLYVKGF